VLRLGKERKQIDYKALGQKGTNKPSWLWNIYFHTNSDAYKCQELDFPATLLMIPSVTSMAYCISTASNTLDYYLWNRGCSFPYLLLSTAVLYLYLKKYITELD